MVEFLVSGMCGWPSSHLRGPGSREKLVHDKLQFVPQKTSPQDQKQITHHRTACSWRTLHSPRVLDLSTVLSFTVICSFQKNSLALLNDPAIVSMFGQDVQLCNTGLKDEFSPSLDKLEQALLIYSLPSFPWYPQAETDYKQGLWFLLHPIHSS